MLKKFLILLFCLPVELYAQTAMPAWIQYYPSESMSSAGGTFTGPIYLQDGLVGTPPLAFADDTDTGIFQGSTLGNGSISFTLNAANYFTLFPNQVRISTSGCLNWTNGAADATVDLIVCKDAANILAIRNSTNAQELRIYETDAANDNYLRILANGSSYQIITGTSGGSHRTMAIGPQGNSAVLDFQTQATSRFRVDANGHFVAVADNTYDIGQSGATRPRTIFLAGSVIAAGVHNSGDGAVGGVAYGPVGDPDTGIYFSGTADMRFAINGTQKGSWSSTGGLNLNDVFGLGTRPTITLDAATTLAISTITRSYFVLACTGAETLNTITGGISGFTLVMENTDTDCTITDDDSPTAAGAFNLTGSANSVGAAGKILLFIYDGNAWQQTGGSVNN